MAALTGTHQSPLPEMADSTLSLSPLAPDSSSHERNVGSTPASQGEEGLPRAQKTALEKREKKQPVYSSPLPPCKICGGKASGLHYGVNTCEACKGFFRRAIKFQRKYRCFRQQRCDVVGGRSVRTSCPFCRLQKCLDMGMAHSAIKTGRYTHAKRTENIMELKRLELHPSSPEGQAKILDISATCNSKTRSISSSSSGYGSEGNRSSKTDKSFEINDGGSFSYDSSSDGERKHSQHLSRLDQNGICVSQSKGAIHLSDGVDKIVDYNSISSIDHQASTSRTHGQDYVTNAPAPTYWPTVSTNSTWSAKHTHVPGSVLTKTFSSDRGGERTKPASDQCYGSDYNQDSRYQGYFAHGQQGLGYHLSGTRDEQVGDPCYSSEYKWYQLPQQVCENQDSFQYECNHPSEMLLHPQYVHPHQQPYINNPQERHNGFQNDFNQKPMHFPTQFSETEPANSKYLEGENGKLTRFPTNSAMWSSPLQSPVCQSPEGYRPIKVEPGDNSEQVGNPRAVQGQTQLNEDHIEGVCIAIPSPQPPSGQDFMDSDFLERSCDQGWNIKSSEFVLKDTKDHECTQMLSTSGTTILSISSSSSPLLSMVPMICVTTSQADMSEGDESSFNSSNATLSDTVPLSSSFNASSPSTSLTLPVSPSGSLSPSVASSPSPSLLSSMLVSQPPTKASDSLTQQPPTKASDSLTQQPPTKASDSLTQQPPTKASDSLTQHFHHAKTSDWPISISSTPDTCPSPLPQKLQSLESEHEQNGGKTSSPHDNNIPACAMYNLEKALETKPDPSNLGPSSAVSVLHGAIDVIDAAFNRHTNTLLDKDPNFLYQCQLDYWKQQTARSETFGLKSEFIRDEIYEEILQRTGLDIDNRKEQISFIQKGVVNFFKSLTNFALEVPGFDKLHKEDMVELIYRSFVELWFLNAFPGVNSELSVMIMPMGKPYTKSELGWVMSEQFSDIVFQQAPSFKALTLNRTIMALWRTIVLLSADRAPFRDARRVYQMQQFYLDLLKFYTRNVWPRDPGLLGRIVDATVRLRDVGHYLKAPRSFTDESLKQDILEIIRNHSQTKGYIGIKTEPASDQGESQGAVDMPGPCD